MNTEQLLNAIGEINGGYVEDAVKARPRRIQRLLTVAAALALALALSVPAALTMADVEPAYEFMTRLSPALAQRLKPVRTACEDSGVRMEVASIDATAESADILIVLTDLEGGRFGNMIDLYDSYRIASPVPWVGNCQLLSQEADTAVFLIHIDRASRERGSLLGKKVTFSLNQLMCGQSSYNGPLDAPIILQDVKSQVLDETRLRHTTSEDIFRSDGRFLALVPAMNQPTDVKGVTLTGLGYMDNQLHAQLRFDAVFDTDAHGFIYFVDEENREIWNSIDYSFTDPDSRGRVYQEQVFDISPDELTNCTLCGWFSAMDTSIRGDWQVTFPLN